MDSLTYQTMAAPPPLDQLVHCFWFLRGRASAALQPVVPDGRAEIILHLGEPFTQVDSNGARRQDDALVSGQLTRPLFLAPSSEVDVVGIRLRTAAARAVLGVALHELTDSVAALHDVAPRLARALLNAGSNPSALAAVLAASSKPAASPVATAAAFALEAPEAPDLTRLARSLGVTTRTLERRCQTDIGVAPGTLRRLARFRRAFQRLERTPPGRWARVAVASGYYDQAHMNRDFREFAGTSPGAFFQQPPDLASAFLCD